MGSKRGYLDDDFRLFHRRDKAEQEFDYHFHEFDKIVVFLSGSVTYVMEGTAYYLEPWDILTVRHDQVHRTIIDATAPYERMVIWMRPEFPAAYSTADCDLLGFMALIKRRDCALIRPRAEERTDLMRLLTEVEAASNSSDFGHGIMAKASLLKFLVLLNRTAADAAVEKSAFRRDERFSDILGYINSNLGGDLSVDALSKRFYMSPTKLTQCFRDMTGCTPHSYITAKRLLAASEMIKRGEPVAVSAAACGYPDYSSFLRAFKKLFGCRPGELT